MESPRLTALVDEVMSEQQLLERIERWDRHRDLYGYGPEHFSDATGQAVGWGGLQWSTIGIGERLTVGYAVAPALWGRGYATEIARASVADAFLRRGADDVRASILSTDTPSRAVAEKAGLTLECEVIYGRRGRGHLPHRAHGVALWLSPSSPLACTLDPHQGRSRS